MVALVFTQVILLPILGGFWYGIRQERIKQERLFRKTISYTTNLKRRYAR